MKAKELLKWGRIKGAVLFIGLVVFFVIIRLPYDEIKNWAISSIAHRTGLIIDMKETRLLFPIGLKLRDVTFRMDNPKLSFVSPKLKALSFRPNLLSLFTGEKALTFEIAGKGRVSGVVIIKDNGSDIELESKDFILAGAGYGKKFRIDRGSLDLNGRLFVSQNHLEGGGELSFSASDLLLVDISPVAPKIKVDTLSAATQKDGAQINLKSFNANVEGVRISGSGRINLSDDPARSRLEISADVDMAGSREDGAFNDFIPLIKGISGGDRFKLRLSGDFSKPALSINGKKVM